MRLAMGGASRAISIDKKESSVIIALQGAIEITCEDFSKGL